MDKAMLEAFESVQVGNIVTCCDEYAHDYTEHMMLFTSIEDDPAETCKDNPKGRKLYGEDISDYNEETMICVVHPGNFIKMCPTPTSWKELYDIVHKAYIANSVELSTGYFDLLVKMPEKDILIAWSRLAEELNGDSVMRKDGAQNFFTEDEKFIPEDEYKTVYEGMAKEFLANFEDSRFHRYVFNSDEETCFIF